ncbi:metal ABC transporter permease [Shimia ponticola]|uniref:metal ABC transporter permease n=1 Tax=Shimia ponticola TaxID=2582893 RepID=UPI0011BEE15A|nr:metal ABC transporter permease [Shimia ponticola]
MLDDFLVRAALAGLGVMIAAAPLGCFVVWRRMAYFGDAVSHAAILGVALSFGFQISIFAGVLVMAVGMALLLNLLSSRGHSYDAALGVLAHSALAAGLVAVSLLGTVRIDLMAFLFGDILAVDRGELGVIWAGGAVVLGLILSRWNALLTATLNPDLAHASGINPKRADLVITLALAITIAVALKVVGALLISALLIIPAATARVAARTPEAMAIIAAALGAVSVLGGLWVSFQLDTPTGPTIVCVAAGLFALGNIAQAVRGAAR